MKRLFLVVILLGSMALSIYFVIALLRSHGRGDAERSQRIPKGSREDSAFREKVREYDRWWETVKEQEHKHAVEHPEVIVAAANNLFDLIRKADYDADCFSPGADWHKFPASGWYGVHTNWPGWAKWCCETFRKNPIVSVAYGKVFMGKVPDYGDLPAIPYKMTLKDGTVLEDTLYFQYEFDTPEWIKKRTLPQGRPEDNLLKAHWFAYYGLDWHLRQR
jgi:hypothetical protein